MWQVIINHTYTSSFLKILIHMWKLQKLDCYTCISIVFGYKYFIELVLKTKKQWRSQTG